MKKIKDAFEKPFRNNATSSLPSTFIPSTRSTFEASSSDVSIRIDQFKSREKGKEQANDSSGPRSRPSRNPSPIWDLELDLDDEMNNSSESGPPPKNKSNTTRHSPPDSPAWDLELDLNPSDDGYATHANKEGNVEFGSAALL